MKKLIYALASTMFVAVSALNVPVVYAQQPTSSSQDESAKKTTSATKPAPAKMQDVNSNDFTKFKLESLEKINDNDKRIADLRKEKSVDSKEVRDRYNKKIDNLEKRNQELKTKIETYKREGKSENDWQIFKKEFKHDLNELGNAFKDIGVRNTK